MESLLYSTFRGNSHTYYGQQSEEKAVKCFEINKNIKTERCGLFISKQFPYLAASPDRVLEDRSALVEIKCPSKSQDLSPEEAVRKKIIKFCTLTDRELKLKKNHDYYFQVQGQMLVTGISQVYFVVWTPKGINIEKIYKDEEIYVKRWQINLADFTLAHYCPK